MTRDEVQAKWDALTPRERDAWVAEKVMGWKHNGDWFNVLHANGGGAFLARADFFSFTTDIGAADTVLKKMVGGFRPNCQETVTFTIGNDNEESVLVEFWTGWGPVYADSMPEAICLAALLVAEGVAP